MRLCTEILAQLQQLKVRNGTASCRPVCKFFFNREVIEGLAKFHKKTVGKFVIVKLKIGVCTLNVKNTLLFVQSN